MKIQLLEGQNHRLDPCFLKQEKAELEAENQIELGQPPEKGDIGGRIEAGGVDGEADGRGEDEPDDHQHGPDAAQRRCPERICKAHRQDRADHEIQGVDGHVAEQDRDQKHAWLRKKGVDESTDSGIASTHDGPVRFGEAEQDRLAGGEETAEQAKGVEKKPKKKPKERSRIKNQR